MMVVVRVVGRGERRGEEGWRQEVGMWTSGWPLAAGPTRSEGGWVDGWTE